LHCLCSTDVFNFIFLQCYFVVAELSNCPTFDTHMLTFQPRESLPARAGYLSFGQRDLKRSHRYPCITVSLGEEQDLPSASYSSLPSPSSSYISSSSSSTNGAEGVSLSSSSPSISAGYDGHSPILNMQLLIASIFFSRLSFPVTTLSHSSNLSSEPKDPVKDIYECPSEPFSLSLLHSLAFACFKVDCKLLLYKIDE